jgi:hypothetical protein
MVRFDQNNLFYFKMTSFLCNHRQKKGLMSSRLVIVDLLPPKRPRESLTMLSSSKPKTSVISLSHTGQETYPFTSCLLYFYLDKTRGCYKELRPTPQPAMFATK